MKKIYLICLTLTLLNFNSIAQPKNDVGYGFKIGGNLTGRFLEKGAITESNRKLIFNFHAGGLLDIPLSLNWKMQPEIQFLRAGFKSYTINSNVRTDITQRLSYVNIPVAFNCYFRDINVKPYFSIGPYFAYALEGVIKTKTKDNGVTTETSRSVEFGKNGKDQIRRFDTGFMLGAGMDLDFFSLELKYSQGVLNQYVGPDDSIYSANMNLALSLIILF